jgi:hypothetical protein
LGEGGEEAVEKRDDRGDHERDPDENKKGGKETEDGPLIDGLLEGKKKGEGEKTQANKIEIF